ncbi:hypothetical protein MLD38_031248 [Melastoma candidum]|uniref:Uncharacterized protein n=1 Tax=Melastoma candidum TaxID=119954 RepID=A0ACB9MR80_9MYRT|nr:hypothetical protein MLD38_031248 [Melastoma candidum]
MRMKREELKDGIRESEVEVGSDMIKSYLLDVECSDEIRESDKFLTDTILNQMVAGRDTTASVLTWFFVMLSRNPGVEHKIREEIDSLMKGKMADGFNLKNETPKVG